MTTATTETSDTTRHASPVRAPLIGIYSSVPQSGKSTAADYLVRYHGYGRLKFAGPLKDMTRALITPIVGADRVEDYIEGIAKHSPIPGLGGFTARWIMQTLGTEWGRNTLDENFWVDAVMGEVDRYRVAGIPIVIDDVRFPNEAEAVVKAGGTMVRIERASAVVDYARSGIVHASEGALNDFEFDRIVYNDDSLAYLYGALDIIADDAEQPL